MTFIGYKQTNKHPNRPANYIDILIFSEFVKIVEEKVKYYKVSIFLLFYNVPSLSIPTTVNISGQNLIKEWETNF